MSGINIRKDSLSKALGITKYSDDINIDNCLFASVVGSTISKGLLKNIEFSKEFDWTDFTIITSDDLKKLNIRKARENDEPILVEKDIEYFGQPIVLLAHKDPSVLNEASKAIKFNYKEAKPIFQASLEIPIDKTLVYSEKTINKGNIDSAFDECTKVFESRFNTQAQEHYYMETQIVIADYNEKQNTLVVKGSMQAPFNIRTHLELIFKGLIDKVIIEPITVGGAFGGREDFTTQLAIYSALLSIRSGKSVKLKLDRSQDLKLSTKRHPSNTNVKIGIKDNKLHALAVDFLLEGGAFETISSIVLNRAMLHITGYEIPNIKVRGRAVKTNTPPNGAFRGFGAPQMFFAAETLVSEILATLEINLLEFNNKYLINGASKSLSGQKISNGIGLNELFNQLIVFSNYINLSKSVAEFNATSNNIKRSIGFSNVFHGAGYTGYQDIDGEISLELQVEPEGSIDIHSSVIEFGQGSHTVLPEILASELNIPVYCINVVNINTSNTPNSGPTVASRTTSLLGNLTRLAATQLKKEIEEFSDWNTYKKALDNYFKKNPNECIKIKQMYTGSNNKTFNESTLQGDAYEDYSQASIMVVIDIDLATGNVQVKQIYGIFDIGKVVNKKMALGQIYGGMVQGIGYTLLEEMKMGEAGYITDSLATYIVPTSLEIPNFFIKFVNENDSNPKGLGELPINTIAPAVSNAIYNLLNIHVRKLPITPEFLLNNIENTTK